MTRFRQAGLSYELLNSRQAKESVALSSGNRFFGFETKS